MGSNLDFIASTLIAFLRGDSMNTYSRPDRITA